MDFDIIGFECSDCTSCELIKHILLSLTFIFSGSKGGIIHAGKIMTVCHQKEST